jgi:hypothetical protein
MAFVGYKILEETITYTGKELRAGWVREKTGIHSGGAAAGFVGPCHVETDDMVDLDDAKAGVGIEAAQMAHVIVEHVGCTLQVAVLRQRLLVCNLCEILIERGIAVHRYGDDVYVGGRKLTVSVAAPSRRSNMIHLGIDVDPEGAPVAAIGLEEMGVAPLELLETLLDRYRKELTTAAYAETKVRSVR